MNSAKKKCINITSSIRQIILLVIITAILVTVLALTDAEKHAIVISLIFDVFFFLLVIILIRTFIKHLKYDRYSYNTIYYSGFSLFMISVLIANIIFTVRLMGLNGFHYEENVIQFSHFFSESASTYIILSFPFILIICVALCISNLALIRQEGARFVNILGILLSLLLVSGTLLLFFYGEYQGLSEQQARIRNILINTFASVYLYFECMVIGVMIVSAISARHKPAPDIDYMIILGCAIRKDGTPTPLLRGRIDQALSFRNEQLKKSGKELTFVTSGGQGSDEIMSESESMTRYLLQKGISSTHLIAEDQSTNTLENMKFSREKILQQNPDAKIAFSTTNYHVFRSGMFANMAQMHAEGIGSRTKWYFWPNALVREFIGLLTYQKKKQSIIIISLIIIYASLAVMAV